MSEYKEYAHDRAAFTCIHVLNDERSILLVSHDHNGDWQFLCGEYDHDGADDVHVVCSGCIFKKDKSLKGIETLDIGFLAERESETSNMWSIEQLPASGQE